jgi:hypothetical protein
MSNRNAVRRQTQGLLAVRRCYDPYLIYCWAHTAISAGKLREVCGERYARGCVQSVLESVSDDLAKRLRPKGT